MVVGTSTEDLTGGQWFLSSFFPKGNCDWVVGMPFSDSRHYINTYAPYMGAYQYISQKGEIDSN